MAYEGLRQNRQLVQCCKADLGGGLRIFGVILAGGAARRMGGRDKALLPLAGRSLLSHTLDRLEPQVERVAISANGDASRFGAGFAVLADDSSHGPLSGILAALEWAAPLGASAVVSVAVDTPFFPADLVPRLCLAAEGSVGGVAIAASGGADHPTSGLWPVELRDALRAFLASGAKTRVMDFANANGAVRAVFGDDGAFRNLNTPEDLVAAEALIGGLT
jgi:molybdenum cofactor guanylyltransferase